MRFLSAVPLAVFATAIVLPDAEVFEQIAISEGKQHHAAPSWKDKVSSDVQDAFESFSQAFTNVADTFGGKLSSSLDSFEDDVTSWGKKKKKSPVKTIAEHLFTNPYLNETKYVTELRKFPELVKKLNSTDANYTLFIPLGDHPYGGHRDDEESPSKEFVEQILEYHVAEGLYPAGRVLASYTLPTLLKEPLLGGQQQRLRTRVGFRGVTVNYFSRVVHVNLFATNGVIHAVNNVVVPPTYIGKQLSLFPQDFSSLLLAYDKTDFVKFIHGVQAEGFTMFAPRNTAFVKLGPLANAFLFNTDKGKKYLKALLKYQLVANATLYSDELYEAGGRSSSSKDSFSRVQRGGRAQFSLPTLLGDTPILVTISRWAGFFKMRINGGEGVFFQDAVAKNGVIHVVDHVPIPPHRHHNGYEAPIENISVEDLIARIDGLEQTQELEEEEIGSEIEL